MLRRDVSGRRGKVAATAVLLGLVALLGFLVSVGAPQRAQAAANLTTQLMVVQGSGNATEKGDYLSSQAGLNTFYTFYVEVPSGMTRLDIDLFDADVGVGGVNDAYDVVNGGSSVCRYTVFNPAGTQVTFKEGTKNGPSGSNGAWTNLYRQTTLPIMNGHWKVTVDMSALITVKDDFNIFGIRAHDGNTSSGGTELPVYAETFFCAGTRNGASNTTQSWTVYPWITGGCSFYSKDFEWDSAGAMSFSSRMGSFNYNVPAVSGNDAWSTNEVTGYTSATSAMDYGIWSWTMSLSPFGSNPVVPTNYGVVYLGNYAYTRLGSQGPSTTPYPEPNSFRIYLPADGGAAPKKPIVMQRLVNLGGINPPVAGRATDYDIHIQVSNPTAKAITFSSSNLVTAFVPGNGCVYNGKPRPSSGSLVSAPSVGGTGTIQWNPGTIAANSYATLRYEVRVTPTSAGQKVAVTGSQTSNGTTAKYVDETGNTSQARATYTFGPLCELSATEGGAAVTLAEVRSFDAFTHPGQGVALHWSTSYEIDNLGFNVYREVGGQRTRLNPSLIQGSALLFGHGIANTQGNTYEWWDADPAPAAYWLEDVDLKGESTWRGPFYPRPGGPAFGGARRPQMSRLLSEPVEETPESVFTGQRPRTAVPQLRPAAARPQSVRASVPDFAALPGIKVGVRREGWYRITQAQLAQAGLAANTDPRQLRLFVDGQEVPCYISGEADGRLDATDTVEFYGLGVDTPYTDTRVYWLSPVGAGGLRLAVLPAATAAQAAAPSFLYTVERRERKQYYNALRNGEASNFFGSAVTATPNEQPLSVSYLVPGTTATLEVALQGVTQTGGTASHHAVRLSVNDTPVGETSYHGTDSRVVRLEVPAGVLVEGNNAVTLTAHGPAPDVSLIDYVRLTYTRSYTANGGSLRCSAEGGQAVTIGGFTGSDIGVLDVTDPNAPVALEVTVAQNGSEFAATLVAPGSGTRVLLALSNSAALVPASLSANFPSTLRDAANRADLLIITHATFAPSLEPLRVQRARQGIQTAVVSIEDVYDEFSFGQKSPDAIKSFCQTAATGWRGAPRWVLLVGDATFDPRNYLASGAMDYVPTKLVETNFFETASDDWFVDFNDDALPDLAVGRLPVRSPAETAAIVAKILAYEKAPAAAAWRGEALFVSDTDPRLDFGGASTEVAQTLPRRFKKQQLSRGRTTDAEWKSTLLAEWNAGACLVNYIGHGSVEVWAGTLFGTVDALGLSNKAKLPVVVSMNCLNGMYQSVQQQSLAETLLRNPNGGAVAVWASSGLTAPGLQTPMNRRFYQKLFAARPATLGEAAAAAKAETPDLNVRRTWVFFGDPSMKLR